MRTLAAFESSLRGMHFGESLRAGQLEFHRQGGVVEATMCLIGDIVIEVVVKGPVGSDNKAVEIEQESAQYTARNSDARQDRAFESSGDAAQAGSAAEPQDKSGGDAAQVGSATAEPQDKSDGDAAQVGSATAEPQDKSGGDAAQVGSAVAEPQSIGPAKSWADIGAQRPDQPGSVSKPDHTHRCDNCRFVKPKVMYHPFMWAQEFHPYSICIQCEGHLQCSGCDIVFGPALSNPLSKRAAFSKTQARKWDGSRKCKDCVRTFAPQAAAQAASQAAAQVVAQDTGAAQAATQATGAVQEAEAPITGASQNAAQDTDATQGTDASQAAAQVVAQDTAAVQEADATEDVVSSTGAADDAARPPNRWQAMDFEDIQDLRRRRDLAALAADEEAALAAEEGAALAADEEAEHSTDAAFPEGAFEDSCVSDAQDSRERFVRVQAEVTKEEYQIWWDVQVWEYDNEGIRNELWEHDLCGCEHELWEYEHDFCGCNGDRMETWRKVEEHFMRVRGRGDVDVQEH